MTVPTGGSGDSPGGLDHIETDWALIHEPTHVVMRYSGAIESYFRALIKNHHDAEEVAQNFFLWVSQNGLPRASKDRGRFRDYLKTVVRNAALNFLRRNQAPVQNEEAIANIPAHDETLAEIDQEWLGEWRRCLLERVWRRLREYQTKARNNHSYTVLRLCAAHPDMKSDALAEKFANRIKKPIRVEAFRQQLSRARRRFAQYLVEEVAQTLSEPEPADVESELANLGLIDYVRDFLPLRRRIATS